MGAQYGFEMGYCVRLGIMTRESVCNSFSVCVSYQGILVGRLVGRLMCFVPVADRLLLCIGRYVTLPIMEP